MTREEGVRQDLSPKAAQLVELARASLGTMSPQQHHQVLARAMARSSTKRGPRLSPASAGALVVAFAAVVLIFVKVYPRHADSAPLSYEIEGVTAEVSGALQAGPASRPRVRFSDGTEVQLAEGARAHIASVSPHGATVELERGEVHAHVIHWAGARWLFNAGPFVVTVTGTAFALTWAPEDDRLDLRLENGTVAVSGPVSDEPIALRAGQWLTIRLRKREVLIRDLGAGEDPEPTPSSASTLTDPAEIPTAAPSSAPTPASAAPRDTAPSAEPKRDWSAMLAAGKLDDVLEDAQRRGIEACLGESSSADLAALGDAARYTRHGDIARRVMLAQRRRFPGTRKAEDAAFLLGRLAETQEGAVAALGWFDKYLSEAPSGSYASEALGRKMTIVQQVYGKERAQTVATEYLRRFPHGTYARAAQSLVGAP